MKKIVLPILMIMVLTLTSFAFADDFSIHSGVKFGMTIDEVTSAESAAGFTPESSEIPEFFSYHCNKSHDASGIVVSGQIAGVRGAAIYYHFTKEEKTLDAAVYLLAFSDSPSDTYSTIRSSLITKYGEPENSMSEIWHSALKPDVYSYPDNAYEQFNAKVSGACEINYKYNDSWLIPQDDGSYVLITGIDVVQSIKTFSTNYSYMTFVGYQHYSKAEVESLLELVQNEIDNTKTQLQDDL